MRHEDRAISTGGMDGVAGTGRGRSGVEYTGARRRDKGPTHECMYCRRTKILPGCEDRQKPYAVPQESRGGPVTGVPRAAGEGGERRGKETGQDGHEDGSL